MFYILGSLDVFENVSVVIGFLLFDTFVIFVTVCLNYPRIQEFVVTM